MGELVEIFTPMHNKTARDYVGRMTDDKVGCMEVGKRFGAEFWDGDRRYGYGGYKYDGRWEPVARALIARYGLTDASSVLDVGCGKGYLLYELKKLLPGIRIAGFDLSTYAIENAKEEIKPYIFTHAAQAPYPFKDKKYDLVISLMTLHNLKVYDLKAALAEIARVGLNAYVTVESYRNSLELFNLQCWALTCEAFFSPEAWVWLFSEFGYMGDYEFIFFQ